ncbi:hypothetical protein PF011_g25494, partial [Phytophthora fragariae]
MTPAVSLTYLAIWPCGSSEPVRTSDCEHCSLNSIIIPVPNTVVCFSKTILGFICKSFASLRISPAPASVSPTPPPLRPNQTNRLRIGTFNVQSLGSHRKQHYTL